MSVISPIGESRYTNESIPTHYVASNIGCNLRQYESFDSEILMILDTYTSISLLSADESTNFNYVEVTLPNKTILNGYIHSSVIAPLG